LEPLKRETFLSNAEINALFGNIQEIVTFQRQFLQNLEHSIELEADFNNFDHRSQFKVRNFQFSFLRHRTVSVPFSGIFRSKKSNILIIETISHKIRIMHWSDARFAAELMSIFLAFTGSPVFHWKCLLILRKSLQAIQLVLRQSLEGSESFTSK